MAGNKTLQKFKESKIPKKGKAKVIVEIPIYSDPNTHSSIIGRIKKNQEISWISKSICDDREWIRCDKNNNYGYIVGYEKDGKCNLEIGTIKENKEESKKKYGFEQKVEVVPITKEEIKLGNEALEEILNDDDDDKKNDNDNNNESKTNISTENDESQKNDLSKLDDGKNEKLEINFGQEEWDNSFEDDVNKIEEINFNNNKLINEIKCQINVDKNKKDDKDKDKGNLVSEVICSLKENLPKEEKTKIDEILKDLPDIHEASQIKKKEDSKNDKKENNKKDKTDEKKSQKKTVQVNGKIYPMDYSSNIGDFNQALKEAKRLYNIPQNQEPEYKTDNYDRGDKWQKGEVYVYKVTENGKTKLIEFRNDCEGHEFEKGYKLPPHINGPGEEHFFYKDKGTLHNVKYKTKEEHEKMKKKYSK
jgi:hypothetical protein